ncbi:MAG: hypothetical protein K940chlam2_00162 [Chlamydiae bacterium]|nr:hypothetical protein [Chlamydiota bacterium]
MSRLSLKRLFPTYHSQCGQDRYVYKKFFNHHRNGVFVDIGAHDGVFINNTNFFEKTLGWTGICVEPNPTVFPQLKENRSCTCIQGCVSNEGGKRPYLLLPKNINGLCGLVDKYDQPHLDKIKELMSTNEGSSEKISVNCYLLNDLLDENGITHINFLSVDTEGGELDILKSLDFSKYQIDVITVEVNPSDERFPPFLEEKGFRLDTRLEQDLIFVHKDFTPLQ